MSDDCRVRGEAFSWGVFTGEDKRCDYDRSAARGDYGAVDCTDMGCNMVGFRCCSSP